MKISDYLRFEYDCRDTQELLTLLIVCPEELSLDERVEIDKHLDKCADCRQDYEGMKLANDMLHANRDFLLNSGLFEYTPPGQLTVEMSREESTRITFQTRLARAGARRKRRERRERIVKIKRIAKPISAVAACIIAVLGLYLSLNHLIGSEKTTAQAVSDKSPDSSVKIELVKNSGTEIIPAGKPIIALCRFKTLRINDNRHMILNTGTKLSIMPHNLGCIVKLDKGEIYTEVEHDGKPFIVETTHGRAVITGTTFNIKADDRQMELAVTEGTVSFEGDKGKVNVTAGHKSLLASNTRPTLPQSYDTKKLTAWATGINASQRIVATIAYQPDFDLPLKFDSADIDFESIYYTSWIEQKRYWFKREFPHIFKFKEALAREGIEVDYPELLMKSGDLLRFSYPEKTRTRLIPASYESIIKLAFAYGKDEHWLNYNLNIRSKNLTFENETSVLKPFDRWLDALEESSDSTSEISSELLTYSLHASMYLYKTRTLFWLAVNNDQITLKAIEKKKTADLLEHQIKAANECVAKFKEMFACGYSSSICDEDKLRELLRDVIENIREITEIERTVAECKFGNVHVNLLEHDN